MWPTKSLRRYAMCRSSQNLSNNNTHQKGVNIQSIIRTERKSDSSDQDSYVFGVSQPAENKVPSTTQGGRTVPVTIDKAHVRMIVDTGATIKFLDNKACNETRKKNPSLHLKQSTHKIYAYMQPQLLPVLGKFEEIIESKRRMVAPSFHVVNGDSGSLLCYFTATELDKRNVHTVTQASSKPYVDPQKDHVQFGNENPETPKSSPPNSPIISRLKKEYPAVFDGIGKFKGQEVHLPLKENAKPIVEKPGKYHSIYANRLKRN